MVLCHQSRQTVTLLNEKVSTESQVNYFHSKIESFPCWHIRLTKKSFIRKYDFLKKTRIIFKFVLSPMAKQTMLKMIKWSDLRMQTLLFPQHSPSWYPWDLNFLSMTIYRHISNVVNTGSYSRKVVWNSCVSSSMCCFLSCKITFD